MTTKELLIAAKAAVSALSRATSQQKNDALLAMAQALEDHKDEILAAAIAIRIDMRRIHQQRTGDIRIGHMGANDRRGEMDRRQQNIRHQ